MRPALLVLLAALLGLSLAPYSRTPAAASCAAPYLGDGPIVLRQHGDQTVVGRAFVDGCQDSMGCSAGPGCDSCEYADPPPEPSQDVELRLRQAHHVWALATEDADDSGRVTWSFELPDGVRPGRARLLAGATGPVEVRIR
jgi:hypothetical protein